MEREPQNTKDVQEELLDEKCRECGGRMFAANNVIVYCEEAWHNPYSECRNIIASG